MHEHPLADHGPNERMPHQRCLGLVRAFRPRTYNPTWKGDRSSVLPKPPLPVLWIRMGRVALTAPKQPVEWAIAHLEKGHTARWTEHLEQASLI
jgi:hypothetical protein